jgi:membrane protein insertase Oxa1/YidC/SpoIIIJ
MDIGHPIQFLKSVLVSKPDLIVFFYAIYIQRLLTNSTFLLVLIAKCLQAFQTNGVITFFPKILVIITGLSQSAATMAGGEKSNEILQLGICAHSPYTDSFLLSS